MKEPSSSFPMTVTLSIELQQKLLSFLKKAKKLYLGDYDYYLEKKQEEEEIAALLANEEAAKNPNQLQPKIPFIKTRSNKNYSVLCKEK